MLTFFHQVLLKSGPYGFYVQLGEDRKGYTPKRASLSHVCLVFIFFSRQNQLIGHLEPFAGFIFPFMFNILIICIFFVPSKLHGKHAEHCTHVCFSYDNISIWFPSTVRFFL